MVEERKSDQIGLISKNQTEEFWGKKSPGRGLIHFSPEVTEKIIENEENLSNYAIIYLSGLSINEMAQKEELSIDLSRLKVRRECLNDRSPAGYRLLRLNDNKIHLTLEGRLLKKSQKKWRLLTLRDALEIIILGNEILNNNFYKEKWHLSQGPIIEQGGKKIHYINLVKKEEDFYQAVSIEDTYLLKGHAWKNLDTITTRR